jgi:gliding motility-associated protein GldM
MASGKLSPRQKMINMMYLVLIALLALNISNEILKAFHLMEVSFNKANQALTDKNNAIMAGFKAAEEDGSKAARAKKWADKAREVQKISSDFFTEIEKYKSDIEKAAGGRIVSDNPNDKGKVLEMSKGDDMEGHKHYLGTDDAAPGKGEVLRKLIDDTRIKMLKVLEGVKDDKATISAFDKNTAFRVEDFKDENGAQKTWQRDVLGKSPVAGVMAMLTKVQNDCKSLETDILTKLAENIDATTVKFDKQAAMIIPESTNVMAGSSFKAKVALMAYNSTAAAEILVNGQKVSVVNGIGEYTQVASGVGSRKVEAKIQTIDPETGNPTYINAEPVEWTSFMPSATISADAMNVLYIGLDNPMSISVPGVTSANTTVTAGSGLTLSKTGDGKFNAKVDAGARETSISVSARMPDGTTKPMGKMPFRIKQVPKPEAMLGSLTSGSYPKEIIQGQSFLNAALSGFVYDGVKFTITKYRVLLLSKKDGLQESSGSGNNPAPIKAFAAKAKKGDIILVDGIYARGPAGERLLNPLTFTIQ